MNGGWEMTLNKSWTQLTRNALERPGWSTSWTNAAIMAVKIYGSAVKERHDYVLIIIMMIIIIKKKHLHGGEHARKGGVQQDCMQRLRQVGSMCAVVIRDNLRRAIGAFNGIQKVRKGFLKM